MRQLGSRFSKIPRLPIHNSGFSQFGFVFHSTPEERTKKKKTIFKMKNFIMFCVLVATSCATLDSNHIKKTTKNVASGGDQVIGGVHVFEVHAPGGGMGLGIKVLLLGVIAVAVGYWCLKEKCRMITGRFTSPTQRPIGDLENAIEMCTCRHNRPAESSRSSARPRDVFE